MSDALISKKWCPSCKRKITTQRESCPNCLADLIHDSEAIECPRCGHTNASGMDGCRQCGAVLSESNDTEAFARVIMTGMRMPRPIEVEPFSSGANASLVCLGPSGDLAFVSPKGWIEAHVENEASGSRYVTDVSGTPLFRIIKYTGTAAPALSAFTPAGESVGTFIRSGELKPRIEVRDGTSAPVGFIRLGQEHGWDVVETGGEAFAHLDVTNNYFGKYSDDSWLLKAGEGPLDLRGMLAMLLAAKMLLGGTVQKELPSPKGGWMAFIGQEIEPTGVPGWD